MKETFNNQKPVESSKKEIFIFKDPEGMELEHQLDQSYFLNLKDDVLEYSIVTPKGEKNTKEWIVFIGGFATTKEQYKREIVNLAKLGKPVVFVNPDKGIEPTKKEEKYFSKVKDSLRSIVVKKAATIPELLKHLHIEKTDVIGNSQGAAVATGFAGAHPNMVKRLVLDCPAGLVGKGTLIDLLHRASKDAAIQKAQRTIHQHEIDPTLKAYDDDVWKKYYIKVKKHLPWRLTKELPNITKVDLRPALKELKENKKDTGSGPEIILLNAYSDVIMNQKKIEENLGDEPFEFVDSWSMYANKNKNHSKYDQPQPHVTTEEYSGLNIDSALYDIFSTDTLHKKE